MRLRSNLALACVSVIGLVASCGGRSGTEQAECDCVSDSAVGGSGGYGGGVVDGSAGARDSSAGSDADSSTPDATQSDSPVPQDAGKDRKDFFDVLPPLPDSGPVGECVNCLQGKCGDAVNGCYNDDACMNGIQCAIPKCLDMDGGFAGSAGGTDLLDFTCLMECFGYNMAAMAEALTMFQCITQTCGSVCGLSLLGGFGGFGPGPAPDGLFGDGEGEMGGLPSRHIGAIRIAEAEQLAAGIP
jgi:hypothetical protein